MTGWSKNSTRYEAGRPTPWRRPRTGRNRQDIANFRPSATVLSVRAVLRSISWSGSSWPGRALPLCLIELGLGGRMVLTPVVLEALGVDVGAGLGGGNTRVAERLLDRADVHAGSDHRRSAVMPIGVRCGPDAESRGRSLDQSLDAI